MISIPILICQDISFTYLDVEVIIYCIFVGYNSTTNAAVIVETYKKWLNSRDWII